LGEFKRPLSLWERVRVRAIQLFTISSPHPIPLPKERGGISLHPAPPAAQVAPAREGKKEERGKLDTLFIPLFESTEGEKTFTAPEPGGFEEQSPRNFGGTAE